MLNLSGLPESRIVIKERAEENAMRIVSALLMMRRGERLSQQDMQRLAGLSQSSLSRMERFNSSPSLDTVLRVAHALGYELNLREKQAER